MTAAAKRRRGGVKGAPFTERTQVFATLGLFVRPSGAEMVFLNAAVTSGREYRLS